jgi:plastocyanin
MQFLLLATSALAASYTIKASDFKFEPAYLEIQVGDSVTWEGLKGHDITEASAKDSCTKKASGLKFTPSTATDVVFETPGDFDYYCSIAFGFHCKMGMKASIKVLAPKGIIAKQLEAATTATVHVVQASSYKYEPSTLTIKVGDSVRWEGLKGHDAVESTASDSCSAKANGFNVKPTAPANTFTTPGVFNYHCSVGFGAHCSRGMKATIIVVA